MITFMRRVQMRNGYFDEATRLLRQRVDYLWDQHGLKLELKMRFGGPVGEIAMISHHRDAAELEHLRQKLMFDAGSNQILRELAAVTLPGETRDEIWMD